MAETIAHATRNEEKEDCGCKNNGTCGTDSKSCRCPRWFLGSTCEINGKELLFIMAGVLGGLMILTALLCIACICSSRNKKKQRHKAGGMAGPSLDSSIIKLPRLWMDHTGRHTMPYDTGRHTMPYAEYPPGPPHRGRRWSFVSDPVRYVDDYVMEDYVHAETLPLPRSHENKKKYLATYQNPSYSSATLPIRPPY